MKNSGSRSSGIGLLFILFALLPIAQSAPAEEVIEQIAATVNGHILFRSDIARDTVFFAPPESANTLRDHLDHLIDLHLLLAEARRFIPDGPPPSTADRGYAAARARFQNEAAFQAGLQETGLSEEALRVLARERAWVHRMIEERIGAFIVISKKEMDEYPLRGDRQGVEAASDDADEIRRRLTAQKEREKTQDYLARLRKQATIRINLIPEEAAINHLR